jgi:hypothetical protein
LAKDYPDECPVFRFVHCLPSGTSFDCEVVGRTAWASFPICIICASGHEGMAMLSELRPLTPAARDLLAAIRQELGL